MFFVCACVTITFSSNISEKTYKDLNSGLNSGFYGNKTKNIESLCQSSCLKPKP